MRYPWSLVPALPIALGLAVGIIVATAVPNIYLAAVPFGVAAVLWWQRMHWWAMAALSMAIGIADGAMHAPVAVDPALYGRKAAFVAVADEVAETAGGVTTIDARVPQKVRITVPGLIADRAAAGDTLHFVGTLQALRPGAVVPLEFDYDQYLINRGYQGRVFVVHADSVHVARGPQSLLAVSRSVNDRITQLLWRSQLTEEAAAFLAATLMGRSDVVGAQQKTQYATAGLAHVLALSGLHVGIIAWIVGMCLAPFRLLDRRRRVYVCVSIVALWAYALVTGMAPSVVRAVVMGTVMLLSVLIGRRHSPWNAWLIATIVLMFAQPRAIYNADFQLTFAAVAAILALARRLNPWADSTRHRWAAMLCAPFAVALAATLGTGLIAAFYFHRFPTYFLLANVAVVWLLPFMFVAAIVLLLCMACGIGAEWLCSAIDYMYDYVSWVSRSVSGLPGADVAFDAFAPWLFVTWFVAIALLGIGLAYRRWRVAVMSALMCCGTLIMVASPWRVYPAHEAFLVSTYASTDVLHRQGQILTVHTTATAADIADKRAEIADRYAHYISTRGVDSIAVSASPIVHHTPRGNIALLAGNGIAVNSGLKINQLVICKGFTSNPVSAWRTLGPDSVIISADLNSRRARRYADSLDKYNIPWRQL